MSSKVKCFVASQISMQVCNSIIFATDDTKLLLRARLSKFNMNLSTLKKERLTFLSISSKRERKISYLSNGKKKVANEPQSKIRSTAIEKYSIVVIKDEQGGVQPSMNY